MVKIYKYELQEGANEITAPIIQVLDIQLQGELPVMWAYVIVDSRLMRTINIQMLWTGMTVTEELLREYEYFKTLQDSSGLVWHVFLKGV